MAKIYLIDSENVGDSWIQLLSSMTGEDKMFVFYTDKSPYISYESLLQVIAYGDIPAFVKCHEGRNALDFQLVSELGFKLSQLPSEDFVIVSDDNGFDAVVRYWADKHYKVRRIGRKFCRGVPSQRREGMNTFKSREGLEKAAPLEEDQMQAVMEEPMPVVYEVFRKGVEEPKAEAPEISDDLAGEGSGFPGSQEEAVSDVVGFKEVSLSNQGEKAEGNDFSEGGSGTRESAAAAGRTGRTARGAAGRNHQAGKAYTRKAERGTRAAGTQKTAEPETRAASQNPDEPDASVAMSQSSTEPEAKAPMSKSSAEPEAKAAMTKSPAELEAKAAMTQSSAEPEAKAAKAVVSRNPAEPEASASMSQPQSSAEPKASAVMSQPQSSAEPKASAAVSQNSAEPEVSAAVSQILAGPETNAAAAQVPSVVTGQETRAIAAAVEPEETKEAAVKADPIRDSIREFVTHSKSQQPEKDTKCVYELFFSLSMSTLTEVNTALKILIGNEAGNDIYRNLKEHQECRKALDSLFLPTQKERFFHYVGIVLERSDLKDLDEEELGKFLFRIPRKNLNSIRASMLKEYGPELGSNIYTVYKPHIKVLNKI